MIYNFFGKCKDFFIETINKLKSSDKRIALAKVSKAIGRKRIEEKMPNLLDDIKDIVDSESQTDPSFKTTKLYTRITVKEVRKQLIEQKTIRMKSYL